MRYWDSKGSKSNNKNGWTVVKTLAAGVSSLSLMLAVPLAAHADTNSCVSVSTSKGNLTAARVGGNVSGDVDAAGCDIGAYFNASNLGQVRNAEIHDANQYGIFVDGNVAGDTTVNVTGSQVYNIGDHAGDVFAPSGVQRGVAIYYAGVDSLGTVSGNVSGNEVSQYQKGGIVVNGGSASAIVRNNTITGLADVPFIAQNGIQFGYGANGQAMNNTINGNWYTGADWASTGILVFESDNVMVSKNTLTNNQTGVDAESWCYNGAPSANNNKFVDNEINGSDYGVVVAAYSLYSECNAEASNNKVTNNTISGTGNVGSEGVFVGSAVLTGNFSPVVNNNKVIHNQVSGFETAQDISGDTAVKVHANSFQ